MCSVMRTEINVKGTGSESHLFPWVSKNVDSPSPSLHKPPPMIKKYMYCKAVRTSLWSFQDLILTLFPVGVEKEKTLR